MYFLLIWRKKGKFLNTFSENLRTKISLKIPVKRQGNFSYYDPKNFSNYNQYKILSSINMDHYTVTIYCQLYQYVSVQISVNKTHRNLTGIGLQWKTFVSSKWTDYLSLLNKAALVLYGIEKNSLWLIFISRPSHKQ